MALQPPEISGLSVVLRGSFNPKIFQPAWFASEGLISKEESDNANIQIIHPKIVKFDLERLSLNVDDISFTAATTHVSSFDSLRDLVLGTFQILRHTPISQMGLNMDMHFRMSSEKEWHAVGDRLAPKEPWDDILEKPGMRSVIIEGVRPDDLKGYIQVRVEPSVRVKPGVYILANDHYEVEDSADSHGCDKIIDILHSSWATSVERSEKIIYSILGG